MECETETGSQALLIRVFGRVSFSTGGLLLHSSSIRRLGELCKGSEVLPKKVLGYLFSPFFGETKHAA